MYDSMRGFTDHDGSVRLLQNLPVPVNFCGLSGTTASMEREGWEIALEKSVLHSHHEVEYRLAGRHREMKLNILSFPCRVNVGNLVHDTMGSAGRYMREEGRMRGLEFSVRICCDSINFMVPENNKPSFQAVSFGQIHEASMGMGDMMQSIAMSMDDLIFFSPNKIENDIYVPEDKLWTLQSHLDAILEEQKPKQKEIREKARKKVSESYQGSEAMSDSNLSGEVKLKLIAF